MRRSSFKKGLYVAVGVTSVVLGAVGIFLPLLPTTPFLLLAAACFARSSDRLYKWLMAHRILGPYIRNYREYGAVTRHAKIVTLALLWGTISLTAFGFTDAVVLRVVLFAIATGVTIHILRMRTATPEMLQQPEKGNESRD
jgi:uncharacterized membrane protein YbaN (DUF454 family)